MATPSIATAFSHAAATRPGQDALVTPAGAIAYAALASRAQRVGGALAARGVGPGARVGVALPRSADAVVALLGVWWCGACVVPLDPAWPAARRAWVTADAGLSCVVCADPPSTGGDAVSPAAEVELGLLERRDTGAQEAPPLRDPVETDATAAALILYTSGSTGVPKGVVLGHGALLRRVAALAVAMPFASDDRACLRTPLTFVDAYAEVLGPLLHGVPSWVLPHPFDVADLVEAIARGGVTRLLLVPSLLGLLLDACPALSERAPALRLVVSSGESLPLSLARRFFAAAPSARLVNVYGSTEVGGDATWAEVHPGDAAISIGAPLEGVQIALRSVDADSEPRRGGTPEEGADEGELVVGGALLALGYWKRPELDAARFLVDPATGARSFLTGDLARRDAAGRYQFRGRLDDQVKVAGVRVELAEVEQALLALPGVGGAAAALDLDGVGRLVALVTPGRASAPLDVVALRRDVSQALPAHAVPSAIAVVDALPRNEHGKIDRREVVRRLRAERTPAMPREGDAPTGASLVARVAATMAAVLGRASVAHDDSFEASGGDSFARLRLLVALERQGRAISLGALPTPLTPNNLAAALEAGEHVAPRVPFVVAERDAAALRAAGVEPGAAFPLTTFQRAMLVESVVNVGTSVWSDQVAYRIDGPLDAGRFEAAWRDEIAAEPALRTVFLWRGLTEPLQVAKPTAPFALIVRDRRSGSLEDYRRHVLAEEWRAMSTSFSLEEAPLLRVALLQGPRQASDVVLTYHHLLLDGESARLVLRRVFDRYARRLRVRPSASFRSFVERARGPEGRRAAALLAPSIDGYMAKARPNEAASKPDGDVVWTAFHGAVQLRRRVAKWRVASRPWRDHETRRLVAHASVAPAAYAGGDMGATALPREFTRALHAWARERAVTPMAVWAALYAVLLARERHERDVIFGVMVSGRDATTADTVGMLANCLPLRVVVDEREAIVRLVERAAAGLRLLERGALASLDDVAPCAAARSATMEHWLVSWGYAPDAAWAPPDELRISNGRGVTIANSRLALIVAKNGEALELGAGSSSYLEVARVRRHVVALAELLLASPADARVAELLDLSAQDGGMWVGLPDL